MKNLGYSSFLFIHIVDDQVMVEIVTQIEGKALSLAGRSDD